MSDAAKALRSAGHTTRPAQIVFDACLWFVMGAFLTSTAAVYIDPLITADLSGDGAAIVGGGLTAIVAILKTA